MHNTDVRALVIPPLVLLLLLVPWAGLRFAGVAAEEDPGATRPLWVAVVPAAWRDALAPLVERRRYEGFDVRVLAAEGANADGAVLARLVCGLCGDRAGEAYVALAGPMRGPAEIAVPAPPGTVGRMAGHPTDNGFGCPEPDRVPRVAVGRLPARSAAELEAMVSKILAFEGAEPSQPWASRISLLVGHPGGSSALEKKLASRIVKGAVEGNFAAVHPRWQVQAIVQAADSPFRVEPDVLPARTRALVEGGQFLTVYLGHSSPGGLESEGVPFLRREDWAGLSPEVPAGILFTCGCYACQVEGFFGEGHAYAAMRNPRGPVAVIGAHGESYGFAGKLAAEGLMTGLAAETPPRRLGDWWLAVARALAERPMGPLTFLLYDRADGSNGEVPLDVQRREHLEMWTLLGDPATRLPVAPLEVTVKIEGARASGSTLSVEGDVSRPNPANTVTLTLEEAVGGRPLVEIEAPVEEGRFSTTLELPADLPDVRLVLRARAGDAVGAAALEQSPRPPR